MEHSPPRGVIRLEAHRGRGHYVSMSVTDQGSGVDPVRRGELLGRFHSEATSAGRRRYGLGLSLADEIVARHGGVSRSPLVLVGAAAASR